MNARTPTPDQQARLQHALALQRSGQMQEAGALYAELLRAFPDSSTLLTNLAIVSTRTGRPEYGVGLLEKSLELHPNQAGMHAYLGFWQAKLGRLEAALASYDRAVTMRPDDVDAHLGRGNVLQDLGRLDAALASYDRVIAIQPRRAGAHNNRGNLLKELDRPQEALASYDSAIALDPALVSAHNNRGNLLRDMHRFEEALVSYGRAIALNPKHAGAYHNRGIALQDLRRFDEALASYDRAIALRPDLGAAFVNRGVVLRGLKRLDEALASHEHALALNPNSADAHLNRGIVLQDLSRLDEALASYERAIALDPASAEAHYNHANALRDVGRLDEALASYDRSIALKPEFANVYWNKSLLLLLTGAFENGWRLYEWRWKSDQAASEVQRAASRVQPLWLGDRPLENKILLIHPEQGYGDFIQFCRYAPVAEAAGASVVLETPAPLTTLAATLPGNVRIVETGARLPDHDLQCPIMSLPLAFKTTLPAIPCTIPYLHADSGKLAAWRERLGDKAGLRVGLAWSGSTSHENDRNRSIPLQALEPLLELPVEFHSLQKEIREHDAAALSQFRQIHSHFDELNDFSDTAALVQEMDLVISVDTAIVHLAGAMGRPVWTLLPYMPDFRWLLDRSDSPWYPTMTLFRQTEIADWPSVIAEVARRLGEMAHFP